MATALGFNWLVWPLSKFLAWGIDLFYFIGTYLPLDLNYFVHFRRTDFYALLIYAALLTFALVFWHLFLKRHAIFKTAFITLLVLFVAMNFANNRAIKISFFDVGHGDMSLIQNGQTSILIDTGDGRVSSHSILRSRGIHDLEVLILSHAHADHIGDALELMANIDIGQIYMNQATYEKLVALDQTAIMQIQNIIILDTPIECVYETRSKDDLILSITPIKGESGDEDPNDDALVVAFEYGDTLGYFLGDISTAVIDDLLTLERETISMHKNIDFVKSAHHGSKTAVHSDLYSNYGIDYVFTSCSAKYKMPNVKLETLLKTQDIQHYTTYENGEIDVTITRATIKIKRFLVP